MPAKAFGASSTQHTSVRKGLVPRLPVRGLLRTRETRLAPALASQPLPAAWRGKAAAWGSAVPEPVSSREGDQFLASLLLKLRERRARKEASVIGHLNQGESARDSFRSVLKIGGGQVESRGSRQGAGPQRRGWRSPVLPGPEGSELECCWGGGVEQEQEDFLVLGRGEDAGGDS